MTMFPACLVFLSFAVFCCSCIKPTESWTPSHFDPSAFPVEGRSDGARDADKLKSASIITHEFKETPRWDTGYGDSHKEFGNPITPLEGRWPRECHENIKIKCNPSQKYQSFDGSCNNLKHPTWGQFQTCYDRLLPPDFADGRSALRASVTGKPLPNARVISLTFSGGTDTPDKEMNQLMMQYGQFIIHDFTLSLPFQKVNCCEPSTRNNPECVPVKLPKDDPFYSKFGQSCHHFIRQEACEYCTKETRETPDQMTAFFDASMIYGPTYELAQSLRGENGTLRAQHHPIAGELMPPSDFPDNDSCSIPQKQLLCFQGGDPFIDEQTASTAIFTMFFREHNRIARGLKSLNPHWDSDRIFYETRRIIIAQIQMITYYEYIPVVLGKERSDYFHIHPLSKGYTEYQPNTNPSMLQSFAHAAMRFGHSQVGSFFSLPPATDGVKGIKLRDMFLLPFGVYNGEYDRYIRGMTLDATGTVGTQHGFDMNNYLYMDRVNITGEDIIIRDIMRGRDHGLPGYIHYLRFCNGPKVKDFDDLAQVMPRDMVEKFRKTYKHVEDIDLFIAALAEHPYPGSLVGPTFNCILGLQFYHLKFGDRYYFEHKNQPGSFTPGQLASLKKTLLSKIVCETTDMYRVQRYVMRLPSKKNPLVPCNEIEDIDLTAWKDKSKV